MSYTSQSSGIVDHAFLKNFYNAHKGYGVLSGMTLSVTGSSLVVTVAAGKVKSAAGITDYPGGTVTCSAGDATDPRMDAIIWDDSASAPAILAGTPTAESATQSKPPLTDFADNDDLLLGQAYITATATTIPSGNLFQRGIDIGSPSDSIIKTEDESVSNSTTLQDDDDLAVALAANKSYTFDGLILYTAGTTGDIKTAFTWPSGATGLVMVERITGGALASIAVTASGSSWASDGGGVTEPRLIRFYGGIITGATPDDLQFQFAQNTSNGTATTVKAGSTLRLLSAI